MGHRVAPGYLLGKGLEVVIIGGFGFSAELKGVPFVHGFLEVDVPAQRELQAIGQSIAQDFALGIADELGIRGWLIVGVQLDLFRKADTHEFEDQRDEEQESNRAFGAIEPR
jgi:hypothetical protein